MSVDQLYYQATSYFVRRVIVQLVNRYPTKYSRTTSSFFHFIMSICVSRRHSSCKTTLYSSALCVLHIVRFLRLQLSLPPSFLLSSLCCRFRHPIDHVTTDGLQYILRLTSACLFQLRYLGCAHFLVTVPWFFFYCSCSSTTSTSSYKTIISFSYCKGWRKGWGFTCGISNLRTVPVLHQATSVSRANALYSGTFVCVSSFAPVKTSVPRTQYQ